MTWLSRLSGYINLYSFKFSKEDHILLVKLIWSILTSENLETRLMETCVRLLVMLMKKMRLLSPEDIQFDWRKLYNIFKDVSSHEAQLHLKVYTKDFTKLLKQLVKICRYYFPAGASREILDEFRPYFCPHDTKMSWAVDHCSLFLPTLFVER